MDTEWMKIRIEGIASIKKVVAEFIVEEHKYTPYGKFKVRILEKQNGTFVGYTNLLVIGEDGYPSPEVGIGDTVEETLTDTVEIFLHQLVLKINSKGNLGEDDFEYADSFDF